MKETCQTIEPLLAGYALDALDLGERTQVESHLEGCPQCQQALVDYQAVSEGLLFAMPPKEPPAYLRTRLLKATIPVTAQRDWLARLRNWKPRILQVSAIAVVLFWVVLNVTLLQNTNRMLRANQSLSQQNEAYQTAFSLLTYPDSKVAVIENENINGTLVYEPDSDLAVLSVRGLEKLPTDQDYQVWLIEPDQNRINGGVFKPDSPEGYISFVIHSPKAMDSFIGIGVTIEPAGGSPGPTGPRVLGTQL